MSRLARMPVPTSAEIRDAYTEAESALLASLTAYNVTSGGDTPKDTESLAPYLFPVFEAFGKAAFREVCAPGATRDARGRDGAAEACRVVGKRLEAWIKENGIDDAAMFKFSEGERTAASAIKQNCEVLEQMLKDNGSDATRLRAVEVHFSRAKVEGATRGVDNHLTTLQRGLRTAMFAQLVLRTARLVLAKEPFTSGAAAEFLGPMGNLYLAWPIERIVRDFVDPSIKDGDKRLKRFKEGTGERNALEDVAELANELQHTSNLCKRIYVNALVVYSGLLTLGPLIALREKVTGFLSIRLALEEKKDIDRSALAKVLERPWGRAVGDAACPDLDGGRGMPSLSTDKTFMLQRPADVARLFSDATADAVRYMDEAQRLCGKQRPWSRADKDRVVLVIPKTHPLAKSNRDKVVGLQAAGIEPSFIDKALGVEAEKSSRGNADELRKALALRAQLAPLLARSGRVATASPWGALAPFS